MKLIDKDALVAEIEKIIADETESIKSFERNKNASEVQRSNARIGVLTHLRSLLNTLDVKEVDLEKEIKEEYLKCRCYGGRDNILVILNEPQFNEIAKYFFELGLKAKHDNWKVVDNTNLPQGDRNKIYCVFTKQRYILATVINHPQDEDLLQWRCTEFPFHRYDMCEGDKYMQII